MYIPRISTQLDMHGISMDIRVYPMDIMIGQDGIYMGYTMHGIYMVYPMYILEIGVPVADDNSHHVISVIMASGFSRARLLPRS